ncbi:unnamed protein product [Cylindrotheca closterium]|uniref:Methyltransferase domain-containing protein n=1 Tax=Cylindrotheca closterium TaxID=2856 RepID=A0AAD2FVQ6_9STRA|nr:unnamed protein product [Cylindrotheca closterium]
MADWEALFAQASDIPTSNSSSSKNGSTKRPTNGEADSTPNDDQGEGRQTTKNKKKSRKKRKLQRASGSNGSSSNLAYQRMLNSRLDPSPELNTPWFSWMTLEQSFLNGNSISYDMEQPDGSSSIDSKIQPSKLKESPITYRLTLAQEQQHSQQESWHLRLFCHSRNLRCCAKLLAQWDADGDTSLGDSSTEDDTGRTNREGTGKQQKQRFRQRQQHQKSLFRSLQSEANEIQDMVQSFLKYLPSDEANLLISKVSDMTGLVEKLLHQRKRERKQSDLGDTRKNKDNHRVVDISVAAELPWSWEPCIRIIMACDALYYRLYYQQLAGMILDSKHGGADEAWYIPHPQFYFGLEGLTKQSKDYSRRAKGTRDKSKSVQLLHNAQELKDSSPELQTLVDHLMVGQQTKSQDPANHVLEAIHRYRFKETMSLFQDRSWASAGRTLSQWKKSLSLPVYPDSKHETPAPQLLMEWRDSCRDFLCHLYAYATVSSKAIRQLFHLLAQLQKEESMDLSRGIVEIGAGTGYLAEILRTQGIAVEAWDIQPTGISTTSGSRSGMNEYHGHVPSFCDVRKGSTFPSTSHASKSALLLCYPPPESPMAFNTLSAYRKAGGKCLIHIGEFKGLTGDSKFEGAVRKGDMHCVARYPCLGWGTDAAYVTVWIIKGSKPKMLTSASVLLPCSNLNCTKESKHRFRPLRQAVYCNQNCYDQHIPVRKCLLSLFNVHADPNLTSICFSKAFAPL